MSEKLPDRVYIDKNDRKIYDEILKNKTSPFFGKKNRVAYMMALVLGFLKGEPMPIKTKEGYILLENIPEEDKAIIKAIAVHKTGNLDILVDKEKVYNIANEYAACGIKFLRNELFGPDYGTYQKKLEEELFEKFRKIKEKLPEV